MGVELAAVDQVADVGGLDDGDAAPVEQHANARHEAVRSGTWARTLLASTTWRACPRRPAGRRLRGRRAQRGGDAGLLGDPGGPRAGRVDAEHGDALVGEVAQQVAVVGGELDHQALLVEAFVGDEPLGRCAWRVGAGASRTAGSTG